MRARKIVGLVVIAAALALGVPGAAAGAPGADEGRITGIVSNSQDARLLPCDAGVGVACFPKKSARWSVDQVGGCWLRSDVTTGFRMMGTCVLAIDEGTRVRLWAPPGAVEEDFRLIWEG